MAREPVRNPQGVADALLRAIQTTPDLRVCQLIVNATGRSDPFYVEDDALIKCLDDWCKAHVSTS